MSSKRHLRRSKCERKIKYRSAGEAEDLAAEGDNYSAAIVCFVQTLHQLGDRNGLGVLSTFAQGIAARSIRRYERVKQEKEAVQELARQL